MTPLDFTRLRYVLGPVLQQQAALQQEGQVLDVLDALMPVIEAEVRALAPASLAAVQAVLDLIDPATEMASTPFGYGVGRWFAETDLRAAITAHFPDPAAPPVPTSPLPGGAAVPPEAKAEHAARVEHVGPWFKAACPCGHRSGGLFAARTTALAVAALHVTHPDGGAA